jgi:hypothetical protein
MSDTAPPLVPVATIALTGSGTQCLAGFVDVTVASQVNFRVPVQCGCGTTTVGSTTTVATTSTTVMTTTPVPGGCPNATNDSYSIVVNQILVNTVTTNDIGCNGASPPTPDTYNVTRVSGPSSGTLVLENNGDFTFTPVTNSLETVTFEYRLCELANPSQCDTATVTITVSPTSCTPVARPDRYLVDSASMFMRSSNVVLNDTSSACNPSGPSTTPPAGDYQVTGPSSCISSSPGTGACFLANFSLQDSGMFTFALAEPTQACPSNYSAVEACLADGSASLDSCRASCQLVYGYTLMETAGPQLSSSTTATFEVVPPVTHVTTAVTCEDSDSALSIGDEVTFIIQVSNANGPQAATNISVRLGVASGLDVQSSTTSTGSISASGPNYLIWNIPRLNVGSFGLLRLSANVMGSSFPYVVTSVISSLNEFDYSVNGHFGLKQVFPAPALPPVTPNQTFTVTNSSSCSTLDIVSAISDPNDNLDLSSLALIVYASTQGTAKLQPSDLLVKFVPTEGYLGVTCFGYRVCDLTRLCSEGKIFVTVLPEPEGDFQVNVLFGSTNL